MKYSKLFTKTNKSAKEYDSINATLLIKGGFINQTMAGVYTFLPLGLRVLEKIEKIVREEMNTIATELYMPAIAPQELWEKTGRNEKIDVLFKVSGANESSTRKNDAEYILNSTHEELITPIAQYFNQSYKDFPFAFFQIQDKFRNEPRAKSGILRGREFRMKDMYSFHTSEDDLLNYYENEAKPAYKKVFERVGLGDSTVIALASGGDFTEKFSHEFQTICDSGEDVLFYDEVNNVYYNREVAPSVAPDFQDKSEIFREREDVFGENIVGMKELVDYLKIPAHKCIKTLIFSVDEKKVIVAALRGDYDIDEGKLKKILGAKQLRLASEEQIKELTGAEVGYAGILNLPEGTKLYIDNSTEPLINFECGANKTHYHSININWGRDIQKPEKFYDFKVAKEKDINPSSGKVYQTYKASEVGNIFPLNTKFSKYFDYTYVDEKGKNKLVYMGCYGIGTSRLIGVIVEKFHDEKGIVWPESVAPFSFHIVELNQNNELSNEAEILYNKLNDKGFEVLWDDRKDVSAGEKFADADLIGIPTRIVVSKRSLDQGGYEVKKRNEKDSKIMNLDQLMLEN